MNKLMNARYQVLSILNSLTSTSRLATYMFSHSQISEDFFFVQKVLDTLIFAFGYNACLN